MIGEPFERECRKILILQIRDLELKILDEQKAGTPLNVVTDTCATAGSTCKNTFPSVNCPEQDQKPATARGTPRRACPAPRPSLFGDIMPLPREPGDRHGSMA